MERTSQISRGNKFPLLNDGVYKSEHISNFFIKNAAEDGIDIDLLRLVKTCYIGYGWVLSVLGKRLIDEQVQAWKWGPVIPSVYHSFKHFGRKSIDEFAPSIDISDDKVGDKEYYGVNEDTQEGKTLKVVWNIYKDMSIGKIIEITHRTGSPWFESYRPGIKGIVIEDENIKKHFDELIEKKIAEAESSE